MTLKFLLDLPDPEIKTAYLLQTAKDSGIAGQSVIGKFGVIQFPAVILERILVERTKNPNLT